MIEEWAHNRWNTRGFVHRVYTIEFPFLWIGLVDNVLSVTEDLTCGVDDSDCHAHAVFQRHNGVYWCHVILAAHSIFSC